MNLQELENDSQIQAYELELHRNTVHYIKLWDDEDDWPLTVNVMRPEDSRKDYHELWSHYYSAAKRVARRGFRIEQDNTLMVFDGARLAEAPGFDPKLFDSRREPGGSNTESVFGGERATTEPICDDDGPLPGKNWRLVQPMSSQIGGRHCVYVSNQFKPTAANLVKAVDGYLHTTGDHACFLEMVHIDHKGRTIQVTLGS